jgi:hypothetical protein
MKNRIFRFLVPVVLILSWISFPGCSQKERQTRATDDKGEIRLLFSKYRSALLSADGKAAAGLVCSQTINWYEQIRNDSLYLEASALRQADIMRKFTILRVRLSLTGTQLENMDGKELFGIAVNNGWIAADIVRRIQLDRINVQGDQAEAYVKGSPRTPAFHFIKERGQWKLTLIKSFALARKTVEAMISSSGMDHDQWLASTFSTLENREVNVDILYLPLAGPKGSGNRSKKISSSISTSVESIISIGEMGIQDQVLYRIIIRGGQGPNKLELKNISDFTVVDTSQTVGVSPVGGQAASISYFDYYLSPRRIGMLTITAQVILVEGKVYKTSEHRVEVLSGSLKAAREAFQKMKNSPSPPNLP